jgi:hypothetical protein
LLAYYFRRSEMEIRSVDQFKNTYILGEAMKIHFEHEGKRGTANYFKKDRTYWMLWGIIIIDPEDEFVTRLKGKEMRKINTMIRNHNKTRLLFLF